jgi:hypothetical protein
MEQHLKLSKSSTAPVVDPTEYQRIVGALRYLVNTMPECRGVCQSVYGEANCGVPLGGEEGAQVCRRDSSSGLLLQEEGGETQVDRVHR